jgi:hypothetical protein
MTPQQVNTIKKEYSNLSTECKKYLDKKDYELLSISRIKISTFIQTIEMLFNIDFHTDENFKTL